jgi:hypothetical protein
MVGNSCRTSALPPCVAITKVTCVTTMVKLIRASVRYSTSRQATSTCSAISSSVGYLNTDRRFVSNIYASYAFSKDRTGFGGRFLNGLNLGMGFHMESGIPISEYLPHPVYLNAGEIPVGGRGKLGRTPFYNQLDLHADYPWVINEHARVSFIADFFNVTNNRRLRLPDQFRQLDLGEKIRISCSRQLLI